MGIFSNHNEDELSKVVLGIAIEVHSQLGPALLEMFTNKFYFTNLPKLELE